MGILHSDIITTEQIPLGKLGWQVWDVGPEYSGTQHKFIENLRKLIDSVEGLTCSTESLYKLVKQEYPHAIGLDMWRNGPGITPANTGYTLPPHYICRTAGNVWMRFLLLAPTIEFNCPDVHYLGDIDYTFTTYAHDYKAVKNETLLDLTNNEDSLSAIGTFVRGSYRWYPLPLEYTDNLCYRGGYTKA